ncbi:MAG: hypothetical protein LBH44_11845 [Treponema sp.]|nr:hypothetical protein [Treponema sp.]
MKDLMKLFGIIALAAVIGLGMAGCDEGGDDEGVDGALSKFYAKANPKAGDTPVTLTGSGNIIEKAIAFIDTDSGTEYTLVLGENVNNVETITHNKDGVTLTITSDGATERKISKGSKSGALFVVGGTSSSNTSSAKLVIDGKVTLQGKAGNGAALVRVKYGGKLDLKGSALITGNTNSSNVGGGGVYADYATITMSGNASIKDNTAKSGSDYALGGGVFIGSGCILNMNGGEISGNKAQSTEGGSAYGGGVYIVTSTNSKLIVASESVKANIKDNTLDTTGSKQGAQVYKTTNGVFEVGGVAADTFN